MTLYFFDIDMFDIDSSISGEQTMRKQIEVDLQNFTTPITKAIVGPLYS